MMYFDMAYRCVHVLFSIGVSKPVLWLSKPACAIIIPLSIQNLSDSHIKELASVHGKPNWKKNNNMKDRFMLTSRLLQRHYHHVL